MKKFNSFKDQKICMPLPSDPTKIQEYKDKQRKSHLGKRCPEHLKKLFSEMYSGRTLSEEHKKKISESHMGIKHTEESKRKISEVKKGTVISEETRIKISEKSKGRKHTEEAKRKIGKCSKGRIAGDKHPFWKGGISFEPYCPKFNEDFKERVRDFFGRACVMCNEIETKPKMSVHHVTYNKNSCCDNSKPLFVTLCKVCHAKVNHNREYWNEYFTQIINEQYNGECYLKKD